MFFCRFRKNLSTFLMLQIKDSTLHVWSQIILVLTISSRLFTPLVTHIDLELKKECLIDRLLVDFQLEPLKSIYIGYRYSDFLTASGIGVPFCSVVWGWRHPSQPDQAYQHLVVPLESCSSAWRHPWGLLPSSPGLWRSLVLGRVCCRLLWQRQRVWMPLPGRWLSGKVSRLGCLSGRLHQR